MHRHVVTRTPYPYRVRKLLFAVDAKVEGGVKRDEVKNLRENQFLLLWCTHLNKTGVGITKGDQPFWNRHASSNPDGETSRLHCVDSSLAISVVQTKVACIVTGSGLPGALISRRLMAYPL